MISRETIALPADIPAPSGPRALRHTRARMIATNLQARSVPIPPPKDNTSCVCSLSVDFLLPFQTPLLNGKKKVRSSLSSVVTYASLVSTAKCATHRLNEKSFSRGSRSVRY